MSNRLNSTPEKTVFIHRLSAKILLFMLAGIAALMAVFFYTSRVAVMSVYGSFLSDKTVMVNKFIAAQIGGDDLAPYVAALRDDEEFRVEQTAFFAARDRLFELEDASAPLNEKDEQEKKLLWEQVRLFYRKNDKFKDEKYARIQAQLEELREAAGLKYLYIFADTGLPGFLTYIVDAHPAGAEEFSLDMDDIGTVGPYEDFTGAEAVMAFRRQDKDAYYEQTAHYGELYSSFSPIFDSQGQLAAFIGADIDLGEMDRRIGAMATAQIWAALAGSSLFILVFYLLLMRIVDLMNEKARAQSASKAKGEFLSRVSHELRSPMNVITGMARLGLKSADEQARERFKSIFAASGHLLRVINDVLDMSSIESGKLEIHRARFNFQSLVSDCADLLRPQAEEKNIEFAVSIDSGPDKIFEVIGDGPRLSQVLVNLLTNAVKFTGEGGRIAVTAHAAATHSENSDGVAVTFSVEDNGIGMSEEFQKKLFSPFEQEDQYIQRKYQGTGLGLSISQFLVGLMGGELTVESRLGAGSRFTFTLPFLKAETAGGLSSASNSGEGKDASYDFSSLRLLVVDDIAINRLILIESLADTGIAVTEAGDGAEALKIFQESEEGYFDAVFMDVQMANMDGYQATEAIRALPRKDAGLPVIAMTANALLEDIEQAKTHGMDGHLSKPLDFDECARVLSKIAEAKSGRK